MDKGLGGEEEEHLDFRYLNVGCQESSEWQWDGGGERPRLGIRAQSSSPWPLLSHVTLIKFIIPVYFSVLKNKIGIIRGLIRKIA